MDKMRDVIDVTASDGVVGHTELCHDEDHGVAQSTLSKQETSPNDERVDTDDTTPGSSAVAAPVHPSPEVTPEAINPPSEDELQRITGDVIKGLKSVYDPEIPVDIYELGLIYRVDLSDERLLTVDMTLTAPGCPVAGEMPGWVEGAVRNIEGVNSVKVNMVFEPPWTPDKMSDEARLELGWM